MTVKGGEETPIASDAIQQHRWVGDSMGQPYAQQLWAVSPELGWQSLVKGQGPVWQSHHSPWVAIANDFGNDRARYEVPRSVKVKECNFQ